MKSVLVLHGPNLARLGKREAHLYGTTTLAQIDDKLRELGGDLALNVVCKQSNHEGVLIDELLAAADNGTQGVLLNAGAFAHTSLAIADAVRAVAPLVVVEVHLTNTAARGRPPLVGEACRARIEGFGADSYVHALRALAGLINEG
jgi:3-dehydroquinate dehydratase II